MISPGEVSIGQHFVLVKKQPKLPENEDAKWQESDGASHLQASIQLVQLGAYGAPCQPSLDTVGTMIYEVKAIDLPLIFASTLTGQHIMLNVEHHDLREVKPEMIEAVRNVTERGGATPTAFQRLVVETQTAINAMAGDIRNHAEALKRRPDPVIQKPNWLTITAAIFWAVMSIAVLASVFYK